MARAVSYEENHRMNDKGQLEKKCNRCGEWFLCLEEYFYKNKSSPDGLFPYCKVCNRKATTEWQKLNPDQYFETYTKRNRRRDEKKIQWQRNHGKEQRESGYQKEYRQKNAAKFNQYSKDRQIKNHKITKEEWEACKSYFNYECAYCGITLEEHKKVVGTDFHREHVDDDGANDLSNCVPLCKGCNSGKWKFTLEEWYNDKNQKFDINRLEKILKWINEDYKFLL